MILEDLIFKPFEVFCPECDLLLTVSFEDLRVCKEVNCTHCRVTFTPVVNANILIGLINSVEGVESKEIEVK